MNGIKEFFEIFFAFAKVGVMTFGGGYSMLPILQKEIIDNKGWIEPEELMDYFAIGQCLPGLIAVNTALFAGHRHRGDKGAIAAALGVSFPSIVIIVILANLITSFSDIAWVQHAFAGIRVCVCIQIFNAVFKLFKSALIDKLTVCIFAAVFVLSILLDISTVWYVIGASLFVVILNAAGVLKEVAKQ